MLMRSMCGVTRIDRVRNEEVRRRIGVTRIDWSSRAVCWRCLDTGRELKSFGW